MFPPKKIVCPTDFSEASLQAIAYATELATRSEAEIYLINVVPELPPAPDPAFVMTTSEYRSKLQASSEEKLRTIAQPLLEKGLRVHVMAGYGDPATEIVRIAKEQETDMIVIATHGNTGWRHLAFGSVAEKVVRLATVPVLSIRMAPVSAVQAA